MGHSSSTSGGIDREWPASRTSSVPMSPKVTSAARDPSHGRRRLSAARAPPRPLAPRAPRRPRGPSRPGGRDHCGHAEVERGVHVPDERRETRRSPRRARLCDAAVAAGRRRRPRAQRGRLGNRRRACRCRPGRRDLLQRKTAPRSTTTCRAAARSARDRAGRRPQRPRRHRTATPTSPRKRRNLLRKLLSALDGVAVYPEEVLPSIPSDRPRAADDPRERPLTDAPADRPPTAPHSAA